MSDFDSALQYVLDNEGGFTDDPEDSGGATNFGITHEDLSNFLGHAVSTDDVRNMTLDTASQIYRQCYWNPMRLDEVASSPIATAIFDTGVNRGISIGAKYAQRVCNQEGASLSVDGSIGPLSLAAINSTPPAVFIQDYYDLVKAGYDAIIANRPSQRVFQNGWMARAKKLLTLV